VRLALSEISTLHASFAEDVAAYAAAGFDAIGIWEFKLPPDDEANLALLREHGLAVANCVPAVPSVLQLGIPGMEGPADPQERIASICASMRRFAAYRPACVLCLSGPLGGRSETEGRALLRDALRRIAAAAREAGVTFGFEPIHAAQRDTTAFVHTVEDALALLDEAGLSDVGLMVDTFNLAAEDPAAVAAVAARVTGVHVAEWPAEEGRLDRVLPGQGDGGAASQLQALRAAGWDGTLDVEIFSTPDGFWALPVDEAARRAYAAAAALRAACE
jgi:sugar phosphate isomerase/epimerase